MPLIRSVQNCVGQGFEQPGLVDYVPEQLREMDKAKGPFQHKPFNDSMI